MFGMLFMPISVGAVVAIPDVGYVQWFLKQQCRNPEITLPAVPNYRAIAGHKYTLGLIDILNENTTTYATDLSDDNLISTSYLDELRDLLKKSSTCWLLNLVACPVYENLLDEKYAANNIHLIPVESAGQCPSNTEFYGINMTSMCAGLTTQNSESSYTKTPQTYGNRGYWTVGDGCIAGPTEIADCETVAMRGMSHCSAASAVDSENIVDFEKVGQFCWCAVTDVARPENNLLPYKSSWIYYNGADCEKGCANRCAYAFRLHIFYRRQYLSSDFGGAGVCGPKVSNKEISYNIASDKIGNWAVGAGCAGETENTDMATMCENVIVAGTASCLIFSNYTQYWTENEPDEITVPSGSACHCRRTRVSVNGELQDVQGQDVFIGDFGSSNLSCRQNCARACAENVTLNVGGMRNALMTLPKLLPAN